MPTKATENVEEFVTRLKLMLTESLVKDQIILGIKQEVASTLTWRSVCP